MIVEYWHRFGDSPIFAGINHTISGALIIYVVFSYMHTFTVKGTQRSYLAATVIKTLCLPLYGAFIFSLAMDIFSMNIVGGLIDAWMAWTLHRDWQRIKDYDDWWKGRGTKMKKKLRSMFRTRSLATAGAGA